MRGMKTLHLRMEHHAANALAAAAALEGHAMVRGAWTGANRIRIQNMA